VSPEEIMNWYDMYHELVKGNITWDVFNEYLLKIQDKSYNEGYEDGHVEGYDEGYEKCQWDRT
jgi:hypothetical protein